MGPRAGLNVCEKSRPHRDLIPGPSSPQPVAVPTELPGPPNLDVVTVHKWPNNGLLPPLFIFSHIPTCPGSYPRLGITALKC
jgi:hypothetical protein